MALRLSKLFGTSKLFLINVQANIDALNRKAEIQPGGKFHGGWGLFGGSRILQALSVEEKLDSHERESADLFELNPEYCINRFITSFQQKRKNDTKRNSQTAF